MGKVHMQGLELYAFHGLLEDERKIGGPYEVDIEVEVDFLEAGHTGDFTKTVDYAALATIAKEEMAIPEKILESVAVRIAERVIREITRAENCTVAIRKLHPPIPFIVGSVGVAYHLKAQK